MKKKYYIGLSLIIFESIASGVYTPLDKAWIIARLGIVLVYVVCALVDKLESVIVMSYLPVILIILSVMSIRDKWQSLEDKKLKLEKSELVTKIEKPKEPILPNCEELKNWRKEICDARVEKLQLDYSQALNKYNSTVINSESKIQTAKVELTLKDQLPIFLYVIFICGLSFIGFKATPKIQKAQAKKEIPKQKTDWEKLVKQFLDTKGKTIETYCAENGIAQSTFKRHKKNYETYSKKSETKLRPLGLEGEMENV